MKNENIHKVISKVSYNDRCSAMGQRGVVLWFTGMSGSGKTSIALQVEKKLIEKKKIAYLLDGDNIRSGLNNDLGFSDDDRIENLRRITETALLFKAAGIITLVSFITPFKVSRDSAREKIGDCYYEIYIKASFETCKKRDPKGLYKKAAENKIDNFTGITSIYEEPIDPDLVIDTEKLSIEESVEEVLAFALKKSIG